MDTLLKKFGRVDSNGSTLLTPFVVCKEKKTLYLHIGKTGGSTVTEVLRRNDLDDRVLTDKKLSFKKKRKYFEDLVEHWNEYFKFTFVRNKYSLLYSLWRYDYRHTHVDFQTFIRDHVLPSKDNYGYWIDQYYLTILNGFNIFDFVGHTENFVNDLNVVCERIWIEDYDPKKRVNVGPYDHSTHYSQYYTPGIQQMVYGKFKQEIDFFGFKVER